MKNKWMTQSAESLGIKRSDPKQIPCNVCSSNYTGGSSLRLHTTDVLSYQMSIPVLYLSLSLFPFHLSLSLLSLFSCSSHFTNFLFLSLSTLTYLALQIFSFPCFLSLISLLFLHKLNKYFLLPLSKFIIRMEKQT